MRARQGSCSASGPITALKVVSGNLLVLSHVVLAHVHLKNDLLLDQFSALCHVTTEIPPQS